MKRIFSFVYMLLLATSASFAKNVVPVYTSCGKVAHIDTDRTSIGNTLQQVAAIEKALCDD